MMANKGGKMRIQLGLCAIGLLVASTVNASAFSIGFKWCGGPSPVFSLSGVPTGTKTLQFHMLDLDKPDYNHGGGNVAYTGQKTIACGALNNYSPPSPPSGSHSYRFDVTAIGAGGTLGSASFTRNFPEK
jgi:phosphatidylethanolamine-binding protein (PEBP) family uncharacterized protein